MKIPLLISLTAAASLHAQAPALTTATLDAAGSLTSGGDVEIAGSLGGFGGLSTDAGAVTARAGFPGQIYDPVSVAITPRSATLQENDFVAFTAEVVCDDDTLLSGSAVAWFVDSQFLGVTSAGEVTSGLLPESFAAMLTATAGGVTGTALLTVTDTDPDNYGDYAADGLPDAWQILHFGYRSSDAGPSADPDQDGQDNQTEWLAGTSPSNASSALRLTFDVSTPPPGTATLVFSPFLPDRTYTIEWSDGRQGDWTPIPGQPVNGPVSGEGLITDASATDSRKLYRLRITVP